MYQGSSEVPGPTSSSRDSRQQGTDEHRYPSAVGMGGPNVVITSRGFSSGGSGDAGASGWAPSSGGRRGAPPYSRAGRRGGRPSRDEMLNPEEEERRIVRRERNRQAAAKCRNRRRELTDQLEEETAELLQQQELIKSEVDKLRQVKDQLELVLATHEHSCMLVPSRDDQNVPSSSPSYLAATASSSMSSSSASSAAVVAAMAVAPLATVPQVPSITVTSSTSSSSLLPPPIPYSFDGAFATRAGGVATTQRQQQQQLRLSTTYMDATASEFAAFPDLLECLNTPVVTTTPGGGGPPSLMFTYPSVAGPEMQTATTTAASTAAATTTGTSCSTASTSCGWAQRLSSSSSSTDLDVLLSPTLLSL
ncbi:unnamed protein product [Lampetra fluviatilis]